MIPSKLKDYDSALYGKIQKYKMREMAVEILLQAIPSSLVSGHTIRTEFHAVFNTIIGSITAIMCTFDNH